MRASHNTFPKLTTAPFSHICIHSAEYQRHVLATNQQDDPFLQFIICEDVAESPHCYRQPFTPRCQSSAPHRCVLVHQTFAGAIKTWQCMAGAALKASLPEKWLDPRDALVGDSARGYTECWQGHVLLTQEGKKQMQFWVPPPFNPEPAQQRLGRSQKSGIRPQRLICSPSWQAQKEKAKLLMAQC